MAMAMGCDPSALFVQPATVQINGAFIVRFVAGLFCRAPEGLAEVKKKLVAAVALSHAPGQTRRYRNQTAGIV
jgi:hypothetical protein